MCQSHWCVSAVKSALFFNQHDRTLGTPDERLWPGVSDFPDYKTSFPKWPVQNLLQVIPALSQPGAELLQVIINEIIFFVDQNNKIAHFLTSIWHQTLRCTTVKCSFWYITSTVKNYL